MPGLVHPFLITAGSIDLLKRAALQPPFAFSFHSHSRVLIVGSTKLTDLSEFVVFFRPLAK